MAGNLVLTPIDGRFDVAAIRDRLAAEPDTFADPLGEDVYVLCGEPALVPLWYRHRVTERRFAYSALVYPGPERVGVDQEYADADGQRSVLAFLRWLTRRYRCRVLDRTYAEVDLTDRVAADGVGSLYPPDVRDRPAPWTHTPIRIGFFADLDGDPGDFTLAELAGGEPGPDEDAVAAYLAGGRPCDDGLRTDGRYVWPADLPDLVRRHHLRLLPSTLAHIRRATVGR